MSVRYLRGKFRKSSKFYPISFTLNRSVVDGMLTDEDRRERKNYGIGIFLRGSFFLP